MRKAAGKHYASGTVPDAGEPTERTDGPSFLKVSDIPSGGTVITFTGESRIAKSKFGSQWVCRVRIGKKEYDWGIRMGASVHRAIQAMTGKRLKPGLKVSVEINEFENDKGEQIKYIAVASE